MDYGTNLKMMFSMRGLEHGVLVLWIPLRKDLIIESTTQAIQYSHEDYMDLVLANYSD
jgi:hypothetical protein